MNIEGVIAALGDKYDADEAAIIEEYLRNHHGTIPDAQLVEEIGLTLAIPRRCGDFGGGGVPGITGPPRPRVDQIGIRTGGAAACHQFADRRQALRRRLVARPALDGVDDRGVVHRRESLRVLEFKHIFDGRRTG